MKGGIALRPIRIQDGTKPLTRQLRGGRRSSADEVVRFLEAIPSLKSCTALTTVYAAGLRSEVVLLKIIDLEQNRICEALKREPEDWRRGDDD